MKVQNGSRPGKNGSASIQQEQVTAIQAELKALETEYFGGRKPGISSLFEMTNLRNDLEAVKRGLPRPSEEAPSSLDAYPYGADIPIQRLK